MYKFQKYNRLKQKSAPKLRRWRQFPNYLDRAVAYIIHEHLVRWPAVYL